MSKEKRLRKIKMRINSVKKNRKFVNRLFRDFDEKPPYAGGICQTCSKILLGSGILVDNKWNTMSLVCPACIYNARNINKKNRKRKQYASKDLSLFYTKDMQVFFDSLFGYAKIG